MLLYRRAPDGAEYHYQFVSIVGNRIRLHNRYGGESESDLAKAVASGYVLRYCEGESPDLDWPGEVERVASPKEAFLEVPASFLPAPEEHGLPPEEGMQGAGMSASVLLDKFRDIHGGDCEVTVVDVGRSTFAPDSGAEEKPDAEGATSDRKPDDGSDLDYLFF